MKMPIELYSGMYGLDFQTIDEFIKDGLIIVDDRWALTLKKLKSRISEEIQRLKHERAPKKVTFIQKSMEVQLIFVKAWSLQSKNLES